MYNVLSLFFKTAQLHLQNIMNLNGNESLNDTETHAIHLDINHVHKDEEEGEDREELLYNTNESPPLPLMVLLGFQV